MVGITRLGFLKRVNFLQRGEGITIACVKRRERGGGDAAGLAFETFGDEPFELGGIKIEHTRHEPERENVFTLILGRAADGLHRSLRDGAADVAVFL